MTVQRIKKLTVEEYVELERSTNTKYEYHNGEVFALAGGKLNHSRLSGNIFGELHNELKLKKSNCEVFNSDTKLHIEKSNKYFYPDTMVVCGDFQHPENFEDAITNPILIVEVLSDSTEAFDRGEKFHKYSNIQTFQEYVLISQYKHVVEVFYRKPKTQTWEINQYEGLEAIFKLQSLSIEFAMKALYERVVFNDDSKNKTK